MLRLMDKLCYSLLKFYTCPIPGEPRQWLLPENMLIKKIGGNWHKIQVWKEWVLSYKSGGVVIINPDPPVIKEYYIPFYHFSDFTIDKDYLFIQEDETGDRLK